MRKLLAILLLAVFGLPLAAPLLASSGDDASGLPACCRRNGRHHCAMAMQGSGTPADAHTFHVVRERCPYQAHPGPSTGGAPSAQPVSPLVAQVLTHHAARIAQTESRQRIAADRARGKRGPPSFQL